MKIDVGLRGYGLLTGACVSVLAGCGDGDTRYLAPMSVALADHVAPVYDDGELTIYQARASHGLPIIAPGPEALGFLSQQPSEPFARRPWVDVDDVGVQVTWTLSNLDAADHSVWVMIDPWNEFGRYEPAIQVDAEEAVRDLSGIDMLFLVPGVESAQLGANSRIVGTFTFDDMDELALDFATVFKILSDAAPTEDGEDPRPTLINHAFNVRNRSYNSPLLEPYRPAVVPALVGFDFGVRTSEPANVALEVFVELKDRHGDRVAPRGQAVRLLDPPQAIISAGGP